MSSRELDRRTILSLIGAGVLGSRLDAAQAELRALRSGKAGPLLFFSPSEHEFVATLAEMIIPADDHSGGAREAGVARYIDLVLANSADAARQSWRQQMSAFDLAVKQHAGAGFLAASGDARAGAVDRTIRDSGSHAHSFVSRMRELTIFGYYSSEFGLLKELEYKGNQVMAMFPGCEH